MISMMLDYMFLARHALIILRHASAMDSITCSTIPSTSPIIEMGVFIKLSPSWLVAPTIRSDSKRSFSILGTTLLIINSRVDGLFPSDRILNNSDSLNWRKIGQLRQYSFNSCEMFSSRSFKHCSHSCSLSSIIEEGVVSLFILKLDSTFLPSRYFNITL